MQERYRVRNGYIVDLTNRQMIELIEDDATLVDIDGMDVEFYIDGTDPQHTSEADESIMIGFSGTERLSSGFPAQFYNVLNGEDLVLFAHDRLDYEEEMISRAGGLLELDPEDIPVDEDEVETETKEATTTDPKERVSISEVQ